LALFVVPQGNRPTKFSESEPRAVIRNGDVVTTEGLLVRGPEIASVLAREHGGPLRGSKATLYEGGTREPCIVRWPGKVKPGSKSDAVICSVDFYLTLLEMAGVQPKRRVQFDGKSFVAALEGKAFDRGPTFWHFPHYTPATGNTPCSAVRAGDWKLIRFWCEGEGQNDRLELYNLAEDMSESKNLAATKPEKVRERYGLPSFSSPDCGGGRLRRAVDGAVDLCASEHGRQVHDWKSDAA
jgi:arylsulfatase A-like enzyme